MHESHDIANEALKKIKATYTFNERDVDDKSIFAHLVKVAPEGKYCQNPVAWKQGDPYPRRYWSEFYSSYVAHAAIETHTASAYMEGGRMIVRLHPDAIPGTAVNFPGC